MIKISHWLVSACIVSSVCVLPVLAVPKDAVQEDAVLEDEGPVPTELAAGFEDLVEVSEVSLDVLATDEDGQLVPGLGVDDFVVLEDGEEVVVTSVNYYSTRYDDAGEAHAEGEIPASRYIILFFHDQTRSGLYGTKLVRQQLRACRDAQRWVKEEMLPSDWLAVVSYDTELRLYQDFTQNRDALVAALQDVAGSRKPENFVPSRREERARRRELEILSRLADNAQLGRETANVYQGLQKVAEASGFLVGRKNLMLYSVGFGLRRSGGRTIPDPRYYPDLETVLNDHNIAVYPIDMTPPGSGMPQEDFLSRLARDTGGFYDPFFVGFMQPMRQISDKNFGYYLITYRSARPAGEIGYQRLEVKARNPEINVQARTGYRYGR